MADASDSNSLGKPCGFNSHLRHWFPDTTESRHEAGSARLLRAPTHYNNNRY